MKKPKVKNKTIEMCEFGASEKGLRNGSEWVKTAVEAKQYPVCTGKARDEAAVLKVQGISCWVIFHQGSD